MLRMYHTVTILYTRTGAFLSSYQVTSSHHNLLDKIFLLVILTCEAEQLVLLDQNQQHLKQLAISVVNSLLLSGFIDLIPFRSI